MENPFTAVWEITMGCNMHCGHCGSSCKEVLSDELSTEEAYKFIDMCAELNLRWITISGGEPTTRKDLPLIIKKLRDARITVNIITNGWLLNEELIQKLKESGVSKIAISLDGPQNVHDEIRREGSFARAQKAFKILNDYQIMSEGITTITKKNLNYLRDIKSILVNCKVKVWQLQLGLPMGNLKNENIDWVISPDDLEKIMLICLELANENDIYINFADSLGYYDNRIGSICKLKDPSQSWHGCNAGIRGFGLLCNGDVVGCTSMRSREFVEGNIRNRSLREIWEDKNTFAWRRNMKKSNLSGECSRCKYGSLCLGGCANVRLTMEGHIHSENRYCLYNNALHNLRNAKLFDSDMETKLLIASNMMESQSYQDAEIILNKLAENKYGGIPVLEKLAYAEFMCENFERSEQINKQILIQDPNNANAFHGLGCALLKQKQIKEGIKYLEKAIQLTENKNPDFLNDLHFAYDMQQKQ